MIASYDDIAGEYYDAGLHPTCANFDELSEKFIGARFADLIGDGDSVIEVGAGKSVVARLKRAGAINLIVLDESASMLSHSRKLASTGATFKVAKSDQTGLSDGCADLVVASMGDPYNTLAFWKEVKRLLKRGGSCLFTSPTGEWANSFRVDGKRNEAEFILRDGRAVSVPSICLNVNEQVQLIDSAGLSLLEYRDFFISDISGSISPKLNGAAAVIRGFVVSKSDEL